jgi:hypothetical protein
MSDYKLPFKEFLLNLDEALKALREGKKIQCEEWPDGEYVQMNSFNFGLYSEKGNFIHDPLAIIFSNAEFNWRIVPESEADTVRKLKVGESIPFLSGTFTAPISGTYIVTPNSITLEKKEK